MTAAIRDPFALVGQTLEGQYRVDDVVGEGGCGVVYRGWHVAFEQPIAIKALKMPEVVDAETRIRMLGKFREEAKLCYVLSQASLSIVRCIGYGALVTPGQIWAPYLVLEWLEGRPLSEEVEARRKAGSLAPSLAEAMALVAPVASGLAYAHSKRVAHRDIKPANLFLLAEGTSQTTIKILDFGIAKVMEEGATAASTPWTKGGLISFTPYYAAPEQIDPRYGPTGPWTDVYAFALVLVELVSGKQPISGPDVVSVVAQVTSASERPTPRTLGVSVPDAVEAAFARALALDPKSRFPDGGAFWDALGAAARMGMTGRHGDVAAPPAWAQPQTMPMAVVSHAGSTLPLAVQTAAPRRPLAVPTPAPGRRPSVPAPAARAGKRRWKWVAGVVCLLVIGAFAGGYALLDWAR